MTTTWDFALDQVFWKAADTQKPADAMVLDHSSVVTCYDCHAGFLAAGPHGAAQNWGLDPDYPGDYTLAELTKYVTANLAYASQTIAGQSLDTTTGAVGSAVPHTVYLKATYSIPASITAGDWMKADDPNVMTSPYFTPLSAAGIAMRAGIDGDGVVRNTTTFLPQATGSLGATVAVYDIYDRLARVSGSSGAKAVICAKCHDLEDLVPLDPANPEATATVVGSNTAHNSHHQDTTDGSAQCVACHIGVPHGWKRPRLLVNTDVDQAPYLDPDSGGVYRSNGMDFAYRWDGTAWVSTPTFKAAGSTGNGPNPGFTRIGMQSLSAVDNHIHMHDAVPGMGILAPGTDVEAYLDTVATDDMIYWSEPGCQACNDHGGEDGVRILEAE